jgi:septal ring factor EnvC (AmiA/AmiB activator)
MSDEGTKLPRGLFGYRRTVVEQILEDRDIMVHSAEERVRRSEARVQQLEGELESVKTQNGRLEAQLERFGEQLDSLSAKVEESIETSNAQAPDSHVQDPPIASEAREAPSETSMASQLMAEELTSILMAGQEAAARMIERARDEAGRQIVEANRLLGEVHTGVREFASWREDVQPVIARVQAMVDAVRDHIAQTPQRVQQSLAPLAEAMLTVDSELLGLSSICRSPFPQGTQAFETGITEDHVEVPEPGSPDDDQGEDSIWLTVEEDQLTVAEGQDDQMPLEASAG